MERYTKEEQDLMKMDILDSFNEANRLDWLRYVFILTHRFYGDFDNSWFNMTFTFWRRYMQGEIKDRFSKKDYLENDKYSEIRETVKAFGLDIEKFWYLLLFIYDYVSEKLINSNTITDVSTVAFAQNLMKQFEDNEVEDLEIIIKLKGKKIPISDVGKTSIITMLLEGYFHLYADVAGYDFPFSNFKDNSHYSFSYKMTMAVELYKYTFDFLENEWKEIHKNKSNGATLNKMLLFSQIMHLYRWTENDNFLYDDSSLKGVLKVYKKKPMPQTLSNIYL